MPNEADHLRKARANEAFVTTLDLDAAPGAEWAIVGLFYAGVHLVEAHLASKLSCHSKTHSERSKAMSLDSKLKRCYPAYAHLETLSRDCRYTAQSFSRKDFEKAKPLFESLKSSLTQG